MWLAEQYFINLIKTQWWVLSCFNSPYPMGILVHKLRALKPILLNWKKEKKKGFKRRFATYWEGTRGYLFS